MTPADSFADFAAVIHGRAPEGYCVDLHDKDITRRGICGTHGRVAVTRQGLCPYCAGSIVDAEEVDRMREVARRFGLMSQPFDAVKAAAAEFMKELRAERDTSPDATAAMEQLSTLR